MTVKKIKKYSVKVKYVYHFYQILNTTYCCLNNKSKLCTLKMFYTNNI